MSMVNAAADEPCHSCGIVGRQLEPWRLPTTVDAVLASLGFRYFFYCPRCRNCGACDAEVKPGEGAPAAWQTLGLPAIHRVCLASDAPAARECARRMRAALTEFTRAGENVP